MNIHKLTREKYIPLKCTYDIIYKCNLRCVHCFQEENIINDCSPSINDIENTIIQLKSLGCMELLLTGGEVFLRDDIFEILSFMKQQKMGAVIFTNGTLLNEEKIKILSSMNIFHIGISIYGSHADVHDHVTQVNGSFKKSIETINLLKKYGIRVVAKVVAMNSNSFDIKNTINMLNSMEVPYEMSPFISEGIFNDKSTLKNRMTNEQIIQCALDTTPLPPVPPKPTPVAKDKQLLCGAGSISMHIAANGDIFPCMSIHQCAGNAYKDSISDIWRTSPVLKYFRETRYVDSECSKCTYENICVRCPGVALEENGSFITKPLEFCRITSLWQKAYYDSKE